MQQARFRIATEWLTQTWNDGNLKTIYQLSAIDVRFHCESGTLTTQEQLCRRVERIRESFSDFHLQIESIADAKDLIVCRWRIAMTHSGAWLGFPPSLRRFETMGITSFRIAAGKINECWEFWDPQAPFLELAGRAPNCNPAAWKVSP